MARCEGFPNIIKINFVYSLHIIKWEDSSSETFFFNSLIYFHLNTQPESGAVHVLGKVTSSPSFALRNIR